MEKSSYWRKRFEFLPGYTGTGVVRKIWKRPAQTMRPALGWCCRCVEEGKQDAWDEDVAPYILQESEWKIWQGFSRVQARRRWMRGRVAAKDAVSLLLWSRFGSPMPLEAVAILPDKQGQPHVVCGAQQELDAAVSISISHCAGSSVALAVECSECCSGAGLDVVSHADNHDGLEEGGFIAAETALLKDVSLPERSRWLLKMWCAKEAAGKALGIGLQGNPLNFVVRGINPARGTAEVEINVNRESAFSHDGPLRMTTYVGSGRDMTFAVARLESAGVLAAGIRKDNGRRI